jgi:hypothetical protein
MTPKEKAMYLYNKFQLYRWDEIDGFLPDDIETKKFLLKLVDEFNVLIKFRIVNKNYTSNYWEDVKNEIKKI